MLSAWATIVGSRLGTRRGKVDSGFAHRIDDGGVGTIGSDRSGRGHFYIVAGVTAQERLATINPDRSNIAADSRRPRTLT